jgi:tetratricopeptide (TPR) repeat protein
MLAMAQDASQPQATAPPSSQTPTATDNGGKNKPASKAAAPVAQAPEKKPSTVDDNPFPEDISKRAAADAKAAAAGVPDAPGPGSPAKGTTGATRPQGSSSLDGLDKLGVDDPARRQLKLESPDGSVDIYDPKRASEDVRVGKFYMQTGYYKGAYARFKDATSFDHENVDAVFWLAEAARKMNLAQEAEQNYELYLAAVPDGANARVARKALGELSQVKKP